MFAGRDLGHAELGQKLVPEASLKIARRFSAGGTVQGKRIPEGRLNTLQISAVPPGRNSPGHLFPPLKWRAIFSLSYGNQEIGRILTS